MKFFIECTQTYSTKFNSGIQRVVRSIVKASMAADGPQAAVPVIFDAGAFVALRDSIPFPDDSEVAAVFPALLSVAAVGTIKSRLRAVTAAVARALPFPPVVKFLYAPRHQFGLAGILFFPSQLLKKFRAHSVPSAHDVASINRGDVLVLLDSSWNSDYWKTVDACRRRGVFVAIVIYDLIPLTHPAFCTPSVVAAYTTWLAQAVLRADALIGISHATAAAITLDLGRFVTMPEPAPRVSYFWLGSELDGDGGAGQMVDPGLVSICTSGAPTYVYVSTVEPRKNHRYALDGFDALWNSGVSAKFVIVGRIGWYCEDFVKAVLAHPQFGKQLFMFNNVDDNGLAYLYATVQGLIFTSFVEGFGLPVVEGLQRGLPVFASDIPVFREIGASGVQFVDLADPASLAQALAGHILLGAPRLPAPVSWLTWQQSAQQLQERIVECIPGRAAFTGTDTDAIAAQPSTT